MLVGSLVLVATSIADTESSPKFVTNAVAPSGVTSTLDGCEKPVMSVGFFVLVATSIVETEPALPWFGNGPFWLVILAVFAAGAMAALVVARPAVLSVRSVVLVATSVVG